MFVLSKLMSAIIQPVFWLAVWWLASLLMLNRWRRASVRGSLVVLGFKGAPNTLLRALENRYPVQASATIDNPRRADRARVNDVQSRQFTEPMTKCP